MSGRCQGSTSAPSLQAQWCCPTLCPTVQVAYLPAKGGVCICIPCPLEERRDGVVHAIIGSTLIVHVQSQTGSKCLVTLQASTDMMACCRRHGSVHSNAWPTCRPSQCSTSDGMLQELKSFAACTLVLDQPAGQHRRTALMGCCIRHAGSGHFHDIPCVSLQDRRVNLSHQATAGKGAVL